MRVWHAGNLLGITRNTITAHVCRGCRVRIRSNRYGGMAVWRGRNEFPFAVYRFKTDGKELLMSMKQIDAHAPADVLLNPGAGGQLAWNRILESLLAEFAYDPAGDIVRLWKVAGEDQPIRIDPAVAFGAPHVSGIAMWVVKDRWEGRENIAEIAEDLVLDRCHAVAALKFEAIDVDIDRQPLWPH